MLASTLTAGADGLAVTFAALGAVLFGLAAVRQHGAVQRTTTPGAPGFGNPFRSFRALLGEPGWLIGTGQAMLAGALHILALALAPITLVQPIGVLAVPVTVLATAVKTRRRPRRSHIIGSVLSVGGVVALTVLLVIPARHALVLPSWGSLALPVLVLAATGVAVLTLGKGRRPLVRCVLLATTAAALFGLSSILVRTVGHILTVSAPTADHRLLVTAVLGIAVTLPVGLWAMQAAYVSGSPQVVICCLTILDPLAAVLGGSLLLQETMVLTPSMMVAGVGCAAVAVAGVMSLSVAFPADPTDPRRDLSAGEPFGTPTTRTRSARPAQPPATTTRPAPPTT